MLVAQTDGVKLINLIVSASKIKELTVDCVKDVPDIATQCDLVDVCRCSVVMETLMTKNPNKPRFQFF